MVTRMLRPLTVVLLAPLAAPVVADDCSTAALNTAKSAFSILLVKTDAHGKKTQSGIVQTATSMYVQRDDGQWTSAPITIKDRVDATTDQLKSAKVTCQRMGSDSVNGTAAAVYAYRIDDDGDVTTAKIWISGNLVVRADTPAKEGLPFTYTSLYDYTHVSAPANAKPLSTAK